MFEQHVLDLRPGDVVAAADDQIVVPPLIPEVAVFVLNVDVAGDVPSAAHVFALPIRLPPVTASGRALDRDQARRSPSDFFKSIVDDLCLVYPHRTPRGT